MPLFPFIEDTASLRKELLTICELNTRYENSATHYIASSDSMRVKNFLNDDTKSDKLFNEYANALCRLFYYRIHPHIFTPIKTYSPRSKTGVFKTVQYIVKYDHYIGMRAILAYSLLGFGKNVEAKIVTPFLYYIFYPGNTEPPNHQSTAAAVAAAAPELLRTIEMQPRLQGSTSIANWYRMSHIATKDHDFIATTMMLSVARSIRFCHDKNLVHGDIKPDNIIIVKEFKREESFTVRRDSVPDAYLIDFGMCGREHHDTGSGGTRPYCAPETLNVRMESVRKEESNDCDNYKWCKLSKAHDVWSLGLMLFTMISYKKLFYRYSEFPSAAFDSTTGYVCKSELVDHPVIGAHALYPVFAKTLCAPENRASVDDIIELMSAALGSL